MKRTGASELTPADHAVVIFVNEGTETDVQGMLARGSGTLVAKNRVVTSTHVVRNPSWPELRTIRVGRRIHRRAEGASTSQIQVSVEWCTATVLWSTPNRDGGADVAVLALADGGFQGLDDICSAGVVARSTSHDRTASAWGWPQSLDQVETPEDFESGPPEPYVGSFSIKRLESNTNLVQCSMPNAVEAWEGYSGTGLFVDRRLTAVVRLERLDTGGEILYATPLAVVWDDKGFQNAIEYSWRQFYEERLETVRIEVQRLLDSDKSLLEVVARHASQTLSSGERSDEVVRTMLQLPAAEVFDVLKCTRSEVIENDHRESRVAPSPEGRCRVALLRRIADFLGPQCIDLNVVEPLVTSADRDFHEVRVMKQSLADCILAAVDRKPARIHLVDGVFCGRDACLGSEIIRELNDKQPSFGQDAVRAVAKQALPFARSDQSIESLAKDLDALILSRSRSKDPSARVPYLILVRDRDGAFAQKAAAVRCLVKRLPIVVLEVDGHDAEYFVNYWEELHVEY